MFSQQANMKEALAPNLNFITNITAHKQIKLAVVLFGEWYIWQVHDLAIQI